MISKSKIRLAVLVLGALSMAITLPSCPGQEEMKQSIDQQQAAITALTKRVVELENQVKTLSADMAQAKTFLPQMAETIQANKAQLDLLETTVKELQTKSKGKRK